MRRDAEGFLVGLPGEGVQCIANWSSCTEGHLDDRGRLPRGWVWLAYETVPFTLCPILDAEHVRVARLFAEQPAA